MLPTPCICSLFLWEHHRKITDHFTPCVRCVWNTCTIFCNSFTTTQGGGTMNAYGPGTSFSHHLFPLHTSVHRITPNMDIFTLCTFFIILSCVDCTHHCIRHSCNYSVTNKIPITCSTWKQKYYAERDDFCLTLTGVDSIYRTFKTRTSLLTKVNTGTTYMKIMIKLKSIQ